MAGVRSLDVIRQSKKANSHQNEEGKFQLQNHGRTAKNMIAKISMDKTTQATHKKSARAALSGAGW